MNGVCELEPEMNGVCVPSVGMRKEWYREKDETRASTCSSNPTAVMMVQELSPSALDCERERKITVEALTLMLERLKRDDPPQPQNFGIKDISLSYHDAAQPANEPRHRPVKPRRDLDDGEPLTAPGDCIPVNK